MPPKKMTDFQKQVFMPAVAVAKKISAAKGIPYIKAVAQAWKDPGIVAAKKKYDQTHPKK